MSLKEQVIQTLDGLSDVELAQVAEYLTFLRFRTRLPAPLSSDTAQLAALYAEFEEEDRQLAEEGMADYAAGLPAYPPNCPCHEAARES